MPKIEFLNLPSSVTERLKERIRERSISKQGLIRLAQWKDSGPEAPEGDWYKDFGDFYLVGSGSRPATVLTKDRRVFGQEID